MAQSFSDLKSLDMLMGGEVQRQRERAIDRLCENIFDEGTGPTAKRKITMVMTVKPTEERDAAAMQFEIKESFAPPIPIGQVILLDTEDDGSAYARQRTRQIPGQMGMMGGIAPEPVTLEMRRERK